MSRVDERALSRMQDARRGNTVSGDQGEFNEDVAKQIENTLSGVLKNLTVIEERVGILWGDVQRAQAKSAVRRSDLATLDDINDTRPASKAAGANPTKAEFDALVTEVQAIRNAIEAIATRTRIQE